jgi:hypothetical protein
MLASKKKKRGGEFSYKLSELSELGELGELDYLFLVLGLVSRF